MLWDRLCFGFLAALMLPKRILKVAVILKPSTLLKLHKALVNRKYRKLFSTKTKKKPGPKGPSQELINLIISMKTKNPSYGYLRIAMQISNILKITINKDIVRRVLRKHYPPSSSGGGGGPSWLTFIGHAKDSLWSLDFFRCESMLLKTHWVMVVMDQFSRRIIGFSVHSGDLNGIVACCMFNEIISKKALPKYLSSDHDPLFKFHRWRANLRILDIEEIKSVPHTPTSHPFIERIIGSVRRELLDNTLFWNANDLKNKLVEYKKYYNKFRCHSSINWNTPGHHSNESQKIIIDINDYRWEKYCRGLFNLPIAA